MVAATAAVEAAFTAGAVAFTEAVAASTEVEVSAADMEAASGAVTAGVFVADTVGVIAVAMGMVEEGAVTPTASVMEEGMDAVGEAGADGEAGASA